MQFITRTIKKFQMNPFYHFLIQHNALELSWQYLLEIKAHNLYLQINSSQLVIRTKKQVEFLELDLDV